MTRVALVSLCSLVFALAACERKPAPVEPALHAAVPASAQATTSLLAPGAPLPDLEGVSQTGERVNLKSLQGKPVVVYFYPKDDTPGCTVEAQEIRDAWQELSGSGAVVVGVSVDDAASHRAFAEKHALPFLLVADQDLRWAQAFGVPLKNGRTSRVSFVFGRDGKLSKVFPAVKPQGHARELGDALHALGA
ncbi:MAG: peroxiredoxin [Myxococcota bacterium]